jgi:hypothetical protein
MPGWSFLLHRKIGHLQSNNQHKKATISARDEYTNVRGAIHSSIPVAINNGLKDKETRTPATRHSIHTGKVAPAMLITGLQPAMKNAGQERTRHRNRKVFASTFNR